MQTLRYLAIVIALFAASVLAQTSAPPASTSLPFALKPLGHNAWAAIDDAKGDAGANAGFVIGDDGVAVIVFAQRNVRTWIHTENLKFYGKDIKAEEKTMVESLGSPDAVYDSGVTLFLGSRKIEVRVFPGHTGGDSVVFVPDAHIAFTGDLFWRKTLPNLIDATTATWISTLDSIAAESTSATTFVPGHGDVGTLPDVQAFRDYLAYLRAQVAGPVKDGKTGDALVAAVLPALTEKYGQWSFFKGFAKPDILNTAAELRGDKKVPQPELSGATTKTP